MVDYVVEEPHGTVGVEVDERVTGVAVEGVGEIAVGRPLILDVATRAVDVEVGGEGAGIGVAQESGRSMTENDNLLECVLTVAIRDDESVTASLPRGGLAIVVSLRRPWELIQW